MWVELSRAWAALGFPCYRFDLSGLGDSPVRAGQVRNLVRAPEAFDDVVDVVHDVDRGRAAGPAAAAMSRRSCWSGCAPAPTRRSRAPSTCTRSRSSPSIRCCASSRPRPSPARSILGAGSAKPVGDLRGVYRSLPSWKVLRLAPQAPIWPSLGCGPASALRSTGSRRRRRTAPTSSASAAKWRRPPSSRVHRPAARPSTRSTAGFEVIEGLDHGLMLARHRAEVSELLTRHLRSLFLDGAGRPDSVARSGRAGSSAADVLTDGHSPVISRRRPGRLAPGHRRRSRGHPLFPRPRFEADA